MALQHLRSSTAHKRPVPGNMSDGQLGINTNLASPGLFFKDTNGDLVKVGPVHVGTTAPNASPASGGTAGNSVGEQWLDTSGGTYVFKVWDGSAWRSETGTFVDVNGDVMTGALGIIAGSAGSPGLYFSGDTNTGIYSPGADQVAISTGGSGRLFVDASGNVDIRSTGPILNIVDTDTAKAGAVNSFIAFRGSDDQKAYIGCPGTGDTRIWGRTADPMLFGTNDTERLRITAAGLVGIGASLPTQKLHIGGTNPGDSLIRQDATTGGTNWEIGEREAGKYQWWEDDNDQVRMTLTSQGRLGIGSTPSTQFSVQNTSTSLGIETDTTSGFASGPTIRGYYRPGSAYTALALTGSQVVLGINDVEKARLDASGRLLVGTSSAADSEARSLVQIIHGSGPKLALGNNYTGTYASGSDAGVITFIHNSGGTYGEAARIEALSDVATSSGTSKPGRLVFSTTSDGQASPTPRLTITSTGQVRLAGAGITFNGDTATANELDDYEEGTFTPTIVGTTSAGTGTYTNQIGRYTKIGDRVTFTIYLNWTAHTGTGNIRVSNLPFTSTSATGSFHAVSIYADGIPFTGPWLQAYVGVNSTNIGMGQMTAAGVVSGIPMDSAGDITITGHYEV